MMVALRNSLILLLVMSGAAQASARADWTQLERALSGWRVGEAQAALDRLPREAHERDPQLVAQVSVNRDVMRMRLGRWEEASESLGRTLAVLERELKLRPLRPVEIAFRTEDEGVYAVKVLNADGVQLAARPIEVREVDREMERTGRDLENLRQWAGLSQGLALPLEECQDAGDLLDDVLRRAEILQQKRDERRPLGMNGWVLTWLLACLGGEWALRKRWGLR